MKLIVFTGEMGSGKSTAIDCIRVLQHNKVKVIKFAEPLYRIQDYVYTVVSGVYEKPENFIKDRKLLQLLGTDWGRGIDENLWIKLWSCRIDMYSKNTDVGIVVTDDLRYDNEAEAVKSVGGIIVKINSKKANLRIDTTSGISNHVSEGGIKMEYVDYVIDNDGSIEDLKEALLTLNTKLHIW